MFGPYPICTNDRQAFAQIVVTLVVVLSLLSIYIVQRVGCENRVQMRFFSFMFVASKIKLFFNIIIFQNYTSRKYCRVNGTQANTGFV